MNRVRINLFLAVSFIAISVMFSNCSGSGFQAADSASDGLGNILGGLQAGPLVTSPLVPAGNNVVAVSVGCGYANEPCVTVTVCMPGTSTCQTIPNVLLDTGSYGLRLFAGALGGLNLPQQALPNGSGLAECQSYVDGTSQWGPVKLADVKLGGDTASSVPIMIDDSTYLIPPSDCTNLDDPSSAGYNGILGVGLMTQDCGAQCANVPNNRIYFACDSVNGCQASAAPVALQTTNPVSMMPVDNNGIILAMPAVPDGGASGVTGYMFLGVGTQSNNAYNNVTAYPADSSGNFKTTYNGHTYNYAYIDSGSNGYFFPASSSIPACTAYSIANGLSCPASETALSAVIAGASGSNSKTINFSVENAEYLLGSTSNVAFSTLAGPGAGSFAWGLPFFFGRTVFVQFSGRTSSLGMGPLWAF